MATTWQALLIAYLVVEWILRVAMLFIVPNNKRPSSATAWILLIMILPTLGALLFFMFGNPRLPKSRRNAQAEVDEMTATELGELKADKPELLSPLVTPDAHTLSELAFSVGGLPAIHGNDITFFTGYKESFTAQIKAMDAAQEFIHAEFFILVLDAETTAWFNALERAAKRGVKIRVLFDRFASARYPGYRRMIQRLREIGVEWRAMLPYRLLPGRDFTRPDLRNHRKLLIIDGVVGFSGSQNIIARHYHRRDDILYEELTVHMKGPIVWECSNVFRADWYAETLEPLLELVEDNDLPVRAGKAVAQIVPSGPSHIHDNNLLLYTSMFHAAKERISIVVPYFVPDDSIMVALTAAAKRGVKVTMINSASIDKLLTGHAQRSYYDELLQAGVELYLYKKPLFLHTKQVMIDSEMAVVGSSNLDIRSFELDLEVNLVIYDEPTVSKLRAIEQDYLERSIHVTLEKWQARSLREKILDRISRLTASLQ